MTSSTKPEVHDIAMRPHEYRAMATGIVKSYGNFEESFDIAAYVCNRRTDTDRDIIQTCYSILLTDPFCTSIPNFVKISETVAEISRLLWFFKMAATAILVFEKFEILTVCPLYEANLR